MYQLIQYIKVKKIKNHLSRDPIMKSLVEKHALYKWPLSEGDIYIDLVEAVIGQQLSVKAADSILKRFKSLFKNELITSEQVVLLSEEKMRKSGLSRPKISYIKLLSEMVINNEIDLKSLYKKSDEQVATELIKIKGVGPWTIDMILIFTLHREDIFPIGDLGIRAAMANLYKVDREDRDKLISIAQKWKPYRSYACRYLWKSLDNLPK